MRRWCSYIVMGLVLGLTASAWAGAVEPDGRAGDAFDFMNLLSRRHLHNLEDERWNVYGQFTWISSFKLPFAAPYTNLGGSTNSLRPDFEHSWTGTLSAYVATKLWRGAEVYWVPEVITGRPLSRLAGLGGVIQNFELQKQGSETPVFYSSRLYYRQTFGLGGGRVKKSSDPMQLGTTVDRRRLVFTFGNFSVLDVFDKNSFAGDLRRQFFNMSFLTYAAYDFAADARGYTWGLTAEAYIDDWAIRLGHTVPPVDPNQLEIDFRFWKYFGEQLEIEHVHMIRGLPGAVRILGYLNRENMARFDEAIAAFAANPEKNATTCTGFNYGSQNATAPDLCWARRPNLKLGLGLNLEQNVYRDIGVFLRAMYSDGRTEVYSYTATDLSLSLGVLARGSLWRRAKDYAGMGLSIGGISKAHADFLRRGGVDGFIGDGRLRSAPEGVYEIFYGVNILSSVWISADYQYIFNPGYNADRGPVHVFGLRAHAEF